MVAEDGELGAHRGPEQPLLSGDHEVDVVVPAQPAGDLHQVGKALARLEGPTPEEVGPAQPEAGQRRLHRPPGSAGRYRGREPVGDDVDPLGIHPADPGAIGGGGAGSGR